MKWKCTKLFGYKVGVASGLIFAGEFWTAAEALVFLDSEPGAVIFHGALGSWVRAMPRREIVEMAQAEESK